MLCLSSNRPLCGVWLYSFIALWCLALSLYRFVVCRFGFSGTGVWLYISLYRFVVCRFGFIAFWLCRFIAFWCVALALSFSGVWLYRFIALWCVALAFWCLALSLYRFLVWLYRFLVSGFIALSLSGVWLYRCIWQHRLLSLYYTRYIHVFAYVYVLKPSLPLCLSHSLSLSPSLSASPSLELCICFGSYIGRAVHASVQNEMVCSSLSLMLTYGSACPGRRSCRLMMHASIYSLLVFFLGAVQLV